METRLPILWNHNQANPIGEVLLDGGGVRFKFKENVRISFDRLFEIFGGAGIRVTEKDLIDGVIIIRAGDIFEFSFSPAPALPLKS